MYSFAEAFESCIVTLYPCKHQLLFPHNIRVKKFIIDITLSDRYFMFKFLQLSPKCL